MYVPLFTGISNQTTFPRHFLWLIYYSTLITFRFTSTMEQELWELKFYDKEFRSFRHIPLFSSGSHFTGYGTLSRKYHPYREISVRSHHIGKSFDFQTLCWRQRLINPIYTPGFGKGSSGYMKYYVTWKSKTTVHLSIDKHIVNCILCMLSIISCGRWYAARRAYVHRLHSTIQTVQIRTRPTVRVLWESIIVLVYTCT